MKRAVRSKKVTSEPLMDFKQNHYGSWKDHKSCCFYNFSSPKLSKHTITFFETVLFNIFLRQTLIDDLWGLHKNMNCAFPLISINLDLLTVIIETAGRRTTVKDPFCFLDHLALVGTLQNLSRGVPRYTCFSSKLGKRNKMLSKN